MENLRNTTNFSGLYLKVEQTFTVPLKEVSMTLIATVIKGQHLEQTSAPEQQYLTSS